MTHGLRARAPDGAPHTVTGAAMDAPAGTRDAAGLGGRHAPDREGTWPASATMRLELLLIAALAVGVRLVQLDHAPYVDELYHTLTARSLLADGTLHINGDVEYTRARLFTWLVAGLMRGFGDSLVVARIPAVIAGAALVAGVFAWLRVPAGRAAAWAAALMLCFAPISIYLSQQVRFYTLQALFFGIGAVAVYHAADGGTPRRRVVLAAAAAACFAMALHLQVASAVGIAAVGTWLLVDRAPAAWDWTRTGSPRRPLLLGTVLLVAAATVAALALRLGPWAVSMFSYADVWAEANRHNARYYHDNLLSQYPTLWTLFPLAVITAASRFARATIFLVVVFGIVLVFHSAAAWKHERYIFYVLPAFFAIWGLALGVALPWLRARASTLLLQQPTLRTARVATTAGATLLLTAALVFAAVGNPATMIAYRMLTVADADWTLSRAYRGEADWQGALPVLRPAAEAAEVVVAASMLKSLYYLGRVDMGLSATEVARGADEREFSVAGREGVPVISSAESLALVHGCFDHGLVIVDERGWRRPWGVRDDAADYLEHGMERLATPQGGGVLAFRWRAAAGPAGAACDDVRAAVLGATQRRSMARGS
jgi:4-amino-4-deoxy-L-arabinose transferase-like glycosyltransferase